MKKKINILLKMFMALSIIVWSIVSSLATSNTAKAKDAHAQQNRIERVKTDLDLSKLQLYQFSLKQENMQIINRGDSVIQGIVEPNTDSSGRKWTKSTVFLMKIDKSKGRQEQVFSNPLKLKFFNAGTVNGKQVDVYIDILEARFIRSSNDNGGGDAAFKDSSKTAVPFLTVDENWGQKSIQIQDYIWPNHPNLKYSLERAFNISVATKVTYKYADGTPMDLKVVMQPSDIDVTNSNTGVKEKFWLSQPETKIDKLVMNNANKLTELQEGGWTYWEHSRNITTEEKWKEHNETGFAVRSIDNTIQFSYTSAAVSGGLFGFYTELPEKAPKKTVDQETIPAEKDQEITYTGKFTSPRPGIDVIGDLRSLKMSDTFDERLDFKSLDVKLEGRTLTFEKDYSISKNGQTVVVEIINKELLGRSSQGKEYEIKYHTKTNDKIKNSGKDIQNRVTMIVDNVELHSNYVKTELLYKQTHEFKSLVPNKDLPKEVIDLTPGAVKGLKNGTVAKPVMPTKTSVVTTDGIWEFKNYDQNQKVVKGADVHFIGYWNFTPHTQPKKEVYTGNTTTNIDGQEVKAGQELTYAITYQNTTGEDRDVTVTDKIPAYTTFVSAEDGGRNENGTVTWNRNVKNGESFTFKFKVKVNGDVNGNKVDNVAKVNNGKNEYTTNETHNPTNPEPKKEVYTGSTTTNIDGQEVKAGQELTYAITYKNTTGEDRDVTVTDKIPVYTTFVSAEDGGRNENGTVTWNRNVKNGESFTFKFKVKVNDDVNGQRIDNVAKVNNGKNEYTTNETHNPTPPTPPVTPPDNPSVPNEPNNNSPLPNTGLAGIDVTGLGVVLAALGTVLYYRKRKN